LVQPYIEIFSKEQVNSEIKPTPEYTITLQEQGIRSLLLVDNLCSRPYLLIGTFTYPVTNVQSTCKMLKWDFTINKLSTLYTFYDTNSIRSIVRYQNSCYDYIIFSTQTDTNSSTILPKIYYVKEKHIKNSECYRPYHFVILRYDCENIYGSIWDLHLDSDTLYVSIPKQSVDSDKLSGFNIRGRLYYFNLLKLFKKNVDIIELYSIIDNKVYPNGFEINSISTFQVETNPDTDIVYVYSLSDFLYQIESLNLQKTLSSKITPDITLLELLTIIRSLISNFDIDGTRIFSFDKKNLYKKSPPILSTVVGTSVFNTIVKSKTSNGYNNFANVYTWCSTSYHNEFYFGTLDIRSTLYVSLVTAIANILDMPELIPALLSLPENLIILITEFIFDPNFILDTNIDFTDKQLYFDVIKINSCTETTEKITSRGFSTVDGINPRGDDGCRNINIVDNNKGRFLLIGTTCYQKNNYAKNFTLQIK